MDQTQKPITDQVAENTDLSKQYQDILNQYSKELQASEPKNENPEPTTPSTEIPTSPPAAQVDTRLLNEAPLETPLEDIPITDPPSDQEPLPTPEPTPVAMPVTSSAPPTPQPVPVSLPPMPGSLPPVVTGLATASKPPKNIFKYFFFVSLLIFLGIFGMIIYTVLNAAANPTRIVVSDNNSSTEPISTADSVLFCETNDKKIPAGESFSAADGCNTCTCGEDLTISCTEKDCSAVPSPVSLDEAVPTIRYSVYTNNTYNYTFQYPATWTLVADSGSNDREFSFSMPNDEKVNGVIFSSTGSNNRSEDTLEEFTLPNNYQLLVTYISNDERKNTPGSKDLDGFKKFLSTFKLL